MSLQSNKTHYSLSSNTILFITAQNNTITITLSCSVNTVNWQSNLTSTDFKEHTQLFLKYSVFCVNVVKSSVKNIESDCEKIERTNTSSYYSKIQNYLFLLLSKQTVKNKIITHLHTKLYSDKYFSIQNQLSIMYSI